MTDMIKNQKVKDILTQICIYLFFCKGSYISFSRMKY